MKPAADCDVKRLLSFPQLGKEGRGLGLVSAGVGSLRTTLWAKAILPLRWTHEGACAQIESAELALCLEGIELRGARRRPRRTASQAGEALL